MYSDDSDDDIASAVSPEPYLTQLEALAQKHESPPSSVNADTELLECDHIHDYRILEQDLARAARRTLDNLKRGRKYDKVLVLALYWHKTLTDRPHLAVDAERLLSVFHDKFGYQIDTHILESEDTIRNLGAKLLGLHAELGSKTEQNLLILYYGGHGGIDEDDSKARLWLPSLKDAARNVDWNTLQSLLSESDFEILFLFDCCYAMSMPNRKLSWRRRCEAVGSSGHREKAGGRPETSFTAALAELLEDDYERFGETSAWRLDSIMKSRDYKRTLKSTPDYEALCEGYPTIPLVPMDASDVTSDGASSASSRTLQDTLTNSEVRITFSLAMSNVPKAREFQRMLGVLPPTVTDIKMEVHSQKLLDSYGLFQSNSALAFLTVPVWFWCAMSTNAAYKYIGLVRSRNLLEDPGHENAVRWEESSNESLEAASTVNAKTTLQLR
ncbi:MAG: hypothetical protein M1821_007408 [Bathelium mastoideum]|nr:MAG: hypothetical protein M1821_007408 [Bathelium mastoideum]